MNEKKFIATLDNCHEEPIHIPGSIQPHGFLLVLSPEDLTILHVSENVTSFTDFTIEGLLNQKLSVLVGEELYATLMGIKDDADFEPINPIVANVKDQHGEIQMMDASLTRNNNFLLLDVEPTGNKHGHEFLSFYHKIRNVVRHLIAAEKLQYIFDYAVTEMRELTGFDRVMLYQFDKEYNGQVVAESKVDDLNSFLMQHFPESDIPAQARALYLKNKVRSIANVHAEPSLIVPAASPIDIGSSSLRSVSPIHIQYLKNMGVEASMSVSIIVEGRLWGLIACHHYSPYVVPVNVKEAAAFLGMIISYLITTKVRSEEAMREAQLEVVFSKISNQIVNDKVFMKALKNQADNLMSLMNATGVIFQIDGKLEQFGVTPEQEWIEKIVEWSRKNTTVVANYYTDQLSLENEEFKNISEVVSGLYFLPISSEMDEYIIWIRPEVIATKNWGGKPEKVIEFRDDGSHRLMPRSSFQLWREKVKYKSLSWERVEIEMAKKFKGMLMNYIVHKAAQLQEANEELEERVRERTEDLRREISEKQKAQNELQVALKEAQISNSELEQFAYVASHDLQEPLRKIQSFGDRLSGLVQDKIDERSQDYLSRMIKASNRMQLLIQDLLSFSRIKRVTDPFKTFNLEAVVNQVVNDLQVLIEQKQALVEVDELDQIVADQSQVYRVFQNMIQNALKFAKPDAQPHVHIGQAASEENGKLFFVKDNGIGFDMAYEEKIFGLFERLHSRADYEGTGLGLAICRKIMERHNGRIWVDSELDKGTTFYLFFPNELPTE